MVGHMARRAPGPLLRGIVARVNGSRASFDGRWGDTAAFMMEAVEVWSELGNERSACNDEVNLGLALCQLGEYEDSLAVLHRCAERVRRVGSTVEIFCTSALAVSRARNGDMDEARALFEALARDEPGKYLQAMSYVYRGWFAGLQGQPARAGELASQAIELADRDAFPQVSRLPRRFAHARSWTWATPTRHYARPPWAWKPSNPSVSSTREICTCAWPTPRLSTPLATKARPPGPFAPPPPSSSAEPRSSPTPIWRKSFLERVSENARIRELAGCGGHLPLQRQIAPAEILARWPAIPRWRPSTMVRYRDERAHEPYGTHSPDVYALAGSVERGYGSQAYALCMGDFSVLIDAGARQHMSHLGAVPAPRYLILTHRHTRAHEAEYEERFGLEVFLHPVDAQAPRRGPAAGTPGASRYRDPMDDAELSALGFRFIELPGIPRALP